jgi:hypothetical protein
MMRLFHLIKGEKVSGTVHNGVSTIRIVDGQIAAIPQNG